MAEKPDMVRVNVTIDISGETLQTIVQTAKAITGRNEKGHYRIDTADLLEDLLSRFIAEKSFETYVTDRRNYGLLDRK